MATNINVLQDRVVLLLINGMSPQSAENYCLQQGATPADAREAVDSARKRITIAADFARDEQLGRAVMRLDDLYAKSIAAQDARTALQAQRELNRLLSLYTPRKEAAEEEGDDGSDPRAALDIVSSHLLPLNLADSSYPVEEHARIAAQIIRDHGLAKL